LSKVIIGMFSGNSLIGYTPCHLLANRRVLLQWAS